MAETFEDHQEKPVSEKETLVVLEAARRLQGWQLHAGSVYKLESFSPAALSPDSPIKDAGVALTEVQSLAAVVVGTYYWDRGAKILYLRTATSAHPNGQFISCVERLFFSKGSRRLPHDLAAGYVVHWEPFVRSTSEFGVKTDHVNQIGQAIEGNGAVTLINDGTFWASRYEKLYFENQRAFIYAWSPDLDATEAKLIYRGKITSKQYSSSAVTFQLQDILYELRSEIPLDKIGDVAGAKIPTSLQNARKRLVYGKVYGHRPTNVDQVDKESGYPLTGTVSITADGTTLLGVGTSFLEELSPDDTILINGMTERLSIDSVESDVSATLSEEPGVSLSGKTFAVFPGHPKRYTNRSWVLAGHALRTPETTVIQGFSTNVLQVGSLRDLDEGSQILVGGSQIVEVRRHIGADRLRTDTNLSAVPAAGTTIKRLPVVNVRINAKLLQYSRDYTVDEVNATLELDPLAEFNIAPVRVIKGTVQFNAGDRTIIGTGTSFESQLGPNTWIKNALQSTYHEVLEVVSDTEAVLRTAPAYTASGNARYKSVEVFDEDSDVLSCDLIGATEDGLKSGVWIKTAAQMVKDLLSRAGLSADVDAASFTEASETAPEKLGAVFPRGYSDTRVPSFRDAINEINASVFGELVLTPDFKYAYRVLSPERSPDSAKRFIPADALGWSIKSQSDKIVGTVRLEYLRKEYDTSSDKETSEFVEYSNGDAVYLARSTKVHEQKSLIVDAVDAEIVCQRWAFLFSVALSFVKFATKLQGARLQVGDQINFQHPKLFERFGSTDLRKIGAIVAVSKSGEGSTIEFEDLANTFARCAVVTADSASPWGEAKLEDRALMGFITDDHGSITNDQTEFGLNVFW